MKDIILTQRSYKMKKKMKFEMSIHSIQFDISGGFDKNHKYTKQALILYRVTSSMMCKI